jgi:Ni,Fe-hydrogenase III component G
MPGDNAMAEEQAIQAELVAKFPFLDSKIRIARVRRMFAEAPAEQAGEVLGHLQDRMQFSILCAMTGLDLGATLGVIYHLARPSGIVLNLATAVPKEKPVLQSVTARFPAAACYERELADLLGFQVQGVPEGPRYPLPDSWPAGQYPLRKDWKPDSLPGAPRKREDSL